MKAEQQHLTPVHPSDVFFLGYALADFEVRTGMDQEALAAFLECPAASLSRLALRGRPDPASTTFGVDLQRLADQFDVNADRLASLLRMLVETDETGAGMQRHRNVTGVRQA
jgi:hypothetical protein